MADSMDARLTLPAWAAACPAIADAIADTVDDQALSDDGLLLTVFHSDAPYGELTAVEAACVAAGVAFDRYAAGKYEYPARRVVYRPDDPDGLTTRTLLVVQDTDEPLVRVDALLDALAHGPLTADTVRRLAGLPAVPLADWARSHAPAGWVPTPPRTA